MMRKLRNWALAVAVGGMPLGTVATCDYDGTTGSFFIDRGRSERDDEFHVFGDFFDRVDDEFDDDVVDFEFDG